MAWDHRLPPDVQAEQPRPGATFHFRFKSGREAQLIVDGAADSDDLLELLATIAGQVPAKLMEFSAPVSQLVLAHGPLPRA